MTSIWTSGWRAAKEAATGPISGCAKRTGTLTFPLDRARELLALFAHQTRGADTRLIASLQLARVPDAGLVARLFGGGPSVRVGLCFLGGEAEGEALARPWLDARPAGGALKAMPPSEIGTITGKAPPGLKAVEPCGHLDRLDLATIDALVAGFEPDDAPVFQVELRHISNATRGPDEGRAPTRTPAAPASAS